VPPSVAQKPLVVKIRYHPAPAVSNLEGTYKHPCTSRPLLKKNIVLFYLFFFYYYFTSTWIYPLYPP
jgi:hypothetical protein